MKKIRVTILTIFIMMVLLQSGAFAMTTAIQTMAPRIVDDPYVSGNKALQLQVADNKGDASWADLGFITPVTIADHASITVQFDIYRANDGWLENLSWGWIPDGLDPCWGAQWDHYGNDPWTYPFGWVNDYEHTSTLSDGWTTLVMTWNFSGNTVSSQYGWQGSTMLPQIDINQPLNTAGTTLYGWQLSLSHDAETGSGSEVVLIDNLVIYGSEIYDSFGFEGFSMGEIDGQNDGLGTWNAGVKPVPAPSSLLLLFSSLTGLVGLRRRLKA